MNKSHFRELSDELHFIDDLWGPQNCEKSSWTVPMADKLIRLNLIWYLI